MPLVSSGQFKNALAEAMRLSDYQVEYPHRVLQRAAEVSKGKRGRGGADVTTRDAATTIIAIACSFISVEILKGAREFSALPCQHTAHHNELPASWTEIKGGPWQAKGFDLPQLQQLPAGHSFIDALTAMIEAARDNAFHAALKKAYPDETSLAHNINVVFGGPEPSASIAIDMWANGHRYMETAGYFLDEQAPDIEKSSAFRIKIEIDFQPIYAVAALFRDQPTGDA